MDNLWPWALGLVVLILLAAVFLPMNRTPAAKKSEVARTESDTEFAAEVAPPTPKVSRESQHEKKEAPDIFIPHHYDVDRLVLAIKDPNWIYAYWEISSAKYHDFVHRYGHEAWDNSRPVLRIYDVTGSGDYLNPSNLCFREIYLDPWADNWFIEVGQPNRTFYAELGRVLANGEFIPLLYSNLITTPPDAVSDRIDEEWMWIGGIYRYIGRANYGLSSAIMSEKRAVEGTIPFMGSSPGAEN